jgi:hypothetical protein
VKLQGRSSTPSSFSDSMLTLHTIGACAPPSGTQMGANRL